MAFVSAVVVRGATPRHAPSSAAAARCGRRVAHMALKPMADRVLVRPDAVQTQSASGLFIASCEHASAKSGVVVCTGDGRYSSEGVLEHMPFRAGERVLWKDDFGAEEVQVDGERLVAFRVFSLVAKM